MISLVPGLVFGEVLTLIFNTEQVLFSMKSNTERVMVSVKMFTDLVIFFLCRSALLKSLP